MVLLVFPNRDATARAEAVALILSHKIEQQIKSLVRSLFLLNKRTNRVSFRTVGEESEAEGRVLAGKTSAFGLGFHATL